MRRHRVPAIICALLIAGVVAATGCATMRPSAQKDTKGTTVRFPPTESPRVQFQAETPRTMPEGPPSIADEYQYRWLKLIEVDVAPSTPRGAPEDAPPVEGP